MMAQQQNARPRARSGLVRLISFLLLALIVIVGLTVLITWLVIRPRGLVYSVDYASASGLNISRDHLTANFDLVLKARNPNRRVTIYYDSIEVRLAYEEQTMALGWLEAFEQPHRNVTRLEAKLVAKSVPLVGSISRDLRREKKSGEIEMGVLLNARVWFKVGWWKSGHRKLKVKCDPVFVHIGSTSHFQSTPCDVDL